MFLKGLQTVVAGYDNAPKWARRKNKRMTSAIFSLVRIWKICHSYPGCSFIWNLRVAYFTVKHPYPCNKYCLYHSSVNDQYKIIKSIEIPDSDFWINLSSVIPGANSPLLVNSQLVCLLTSLGFLTGREGDVNMTMKSPFRGVIIK